MNVVAIYSTSLNAGYPWHITLFKRIRHFIMCPFAFSVCFHCKSFTRLESKGKNVEIYKVYLKITFR